MDPGHQHGSMYPSVDSGLYIFVHALKINDLYLCGVLFQFYGLHRGGLIIGWENNTCFFDDEGRASYFHKDLVDSRQGEFGAEDA